MWYHKSIFIKETEKMLLNIVKILIIAISIVIAWDDYDAYRGVKKALKKESYKTQKRNDVLEAILATKGHKDSSIISKRYIPVFIYSIVVVLLETTIVPKDIISIGTSVVALTMTIVFKHKCNHEYDWLKRNIQN